MGLAAVRSHRYCEKTLAREKTQKLEVELLVLCVELSVSLVLVVSSSSPVKVTFVQVKLFKIHYLYSLIIYSSLFDSTCFIDLQVKGIKYNIGS